MTEPSFTRELARTPECARLAREFLEESIPDSPSLDSALLVVSELVTNAFQHGIGPIGIALSMDGQSDVTVCVTSGIDPARGEPNLTAVGEVGKLTERGRGLSIVAALSTGWDWEISRQIPPSQLAQLTVRASITASS